MLVYIKPYMQERLGLCPSGSGCGWLPERPFLIVIYHSTYSRQGIECCQKALYTLL